jgi:hypothetical protein
VTLKVDIFPVVSWQENIVTCAVFVVDKSVNDNLLYWPNLNEV